MNDVYRFRIYPNKGQQELFTKTFGCVRFIYNRMLAEKMEYYDNTGKDLKVTPAKYKAEFPWLKEVDSLALCNAQLHLQAAYKNFFRNPLVGFPKFKSKKKPVRSYTTNCVNGNIQLKEGKLRLPKTGWVKIKQHRRIREDDVLKGAAICQEADGKYYVSLLYEREEPQRLPIVPDNAVGLDFSMAGLYVASDGEQGDYPRYYRKSQEKLARGQRKLSHCEKGSRRYEKQKRKVARLHSHVVHQRKDFLHKASRKITNSYDIVCIEDLDMKEMGRGLHFGKSVADNGWGMFTGFLGYKLEREGKQLVRIGRWYPSSKTCSRCGKVKPSMGLEERIYDCTCGNHMDRDWNASINIRREGLRMIGIDLDRERTAF